MGFWPLQYLRDKSIDWFWRYFWLNYGAGVVAMLIALWTQIVNLPGPIQVVIFLNSIAALLLINHFALIPLWRFCVAGGFKGRQKQAISIRLSELMSAGNEIRLQFLNRDHQEEISQSMENWLSDCRNYIKERLSETKLREFDNPICINPGLRYMELSNAGNSFVSFVEDRVAVLREFMREFDT